MQNMVFYRFKSDKNKWTSDIRRGMINEPSQMCKISIFDHDKRQEHLYTVSPISWTLTVWWAEQMKIVFIENYHGNGCGFAKNKQFINEFVWGR